MVALFFGIGLAGWVYFQAMRRMPGNIMAVWVSAIGAGLVGAFVIYTLFAWVFNQ